MQAVVTHPLQWAGEDWEEKVARLRLELDGAAMLVTEWDEVAWLFNLRGEGGYSSVSSLCSMVRTDDHEEWPLNDCRSS